MEKIKLVVILIVCFAFFGFILGDASAEEINLTITGGVYRMITSPVMPEDPDPQVSLADDLGAYDETQWRFFRYNPARGDYDELKSPDWDPIEDNFYFGRGYWIISKDTKTIDIQGDPAGAVNQITLHWEGDGWNQIGNIYSQNFTIGMFPNCNLWVEPEKPGPSEMAYQLNDPNNPYTYVTLQEYIGGVSYTDIGDEAGEMLETGKGYWLKNTYSKDLTISFAPAGLSSVSTTNSDNFMNQDFFARVAEQEVPPDPPAGIEGPSSASSGSGSGGCFIATAAYGDYHHPHVGPLRKFKNRYLLRNSFGKMLVGMYYRYSPALARFVARRESIKALIRFNLTPIAGASAVLSKMNICGFLLVVAFSFLGSFFFLRGRKEAWGEWNLKLSGKMRKEKKRG